MLRAIYITGSYLFLQKNRDIDIVYYYDTQEEAREALIHGKKDHRFCEHFDSIERLPRLMLCCYMYPLMKLRSGEDLHLEQYSIFGRKEEYITYLKKTIEWLPRNNKNWYHVLTAVYILENESYELTEKQLANIQLVHNREYINCKLYNHIIDYLKKV